MERTARVWASDCNDPLTSPHGGGLTPGWHEAGEVELTGAHLADHGVALHVHDPQAATVLAIVAVG